MWVRGAGERLTTSQGMRVHHTISSQLQFYSSFLLLVSRPSLFPMILLGRVVSRVSRVRVRGTRQGRSNARTLHHHR